MRIWYLLENHITMLRKARETKLKLIQEANKRLLNEKDQPALIDFEVDGIRTQISNLNTAIDKWDRKVKATSPEGSVEKLKKLNNLLKKANDYLLNDLGVGG